VYIKDPYVAKYVTEEKITIISFVGRVGGILGLFLGFSFISSVEVAYFLGYKFLPIKLIQFVEKNQKKTTTYIRVNEQHHQY
jgi:hypothetical protein